MVARTARPASEDPTPGPVVVGIDPGLTRCGVGVVAGSRARLHHVAHETIRTPADLPLAQRLALLFDGIEALLAEHAPAVVAVERVLFSRNVNTAMATGQAAGVVLLAAQRANAHVREITPTRIKSVVAGHGDADKDAVARMVTAQLRLDAVPTPADAADALAVAMAAVFDTGPLADRTGGASRRAGGWEAHVAARGLDVVGGTAAGSHA